MRLAQVRAARAGAQLLHRPRGLSAEDVVGHLCAVQAQDFRGFRHALRVRSRDVTHDGLERAIADGRTLVVTWLQRGTIHLARRDDVPWMLGLFAPTRHNGVAKRLADFGISRDLQDARIDAVAALLADRGPLARDEIHAAFPDVPREAITHLLFAASYRGLVVRGPFTRTGGEQRFAHVVDWLGVDRLPTSLAGEERDRALRELALRYLRAHAPADDRDLAKWAGLPLRDARRGLELLGAAAPAPPATTAALPTALLPPWDEYLLGWADQSFMVGEDDRHRIAHGAGGVLSPTVLHRGAAVATWGTRRTPGSVAITITPFGPLAGSVRNAIEREAANVARYEGRSLQSLTFADRQTGTR